MKEEEKFDATHELFKMMKEQLKEKDERIKELEALLNKSPKENKDFIND